MSQYQRLMQEFDVSSGGTNDSGRTLLSHPTKRWFSPRGLAALVAGALTLTVAVSASAQDQNPLDRVDSPDPDSQQPVHQPAPQHPTQPPAGHPPPPAQHHHHPPPDRAAPPRGPKVVGYDERSKPRTGLIVGGAIMFAVAYGIPLSIVAGADFRNQTQWMAVPVIGPWMTIGRMRYGSCSNRRFVEEDCDDSGERAGDTLGAVAAGFAGVIQLGGLAMLISGAAAQETEVVPVYAVAPMPLEGGGGLAVTGTF